MSYYNDIEPDEIPEKDKCGNCGEDLAINAVENPSVDYLTVVCSECGSTNEISMTRLEMLQKQEKVKEK